MLFLLAVLLLTSCAPRPTKVATAEPITHTPVTPTPVVEEYGGQGVTVEIPFQKSETVLHSQKKDFDFDPMKIPVTEGYDIIRPLLYLDILDQGEKVVNSFSPPIILTIKYTLDDRKAAGSDDRIVVLIFERSGGQEGQWIACDGKTMTDKTKCTPTDSTPYSEEKGYGTITVTIDVWTSGTGLGKR
jgi:hypothetical protein